MTKQFQVYGDYALNSQTLLHETDTLAEGIQWVQGYTKNLDLGGFEKIEVGEFLEDGEWFDYYFVVDMEWED